jgi:hypothetical protein
MKNRNALLIIIGIFCIVTLSAKQKIQQTTDVASKTSLYGNIIYDAKTNPAFSTPSWTAFFVKSENTKIAFTTEGLTINTSNLGGIYGYSLSDTDFNPDTDNYSVEIQSANKSPNSGLGIDVRSKTGRRVFVSVLGKYIVNEATGDTLVKNIDNSTTANYRLSVEGETASIYKDSLKVGTVSTDRTDMISNPGFENKTIDYKLWGGELNWTKPYIDSLPANVHSGKYSMRWRNRYTGIFRGYFKVQPNAKYRLTFWAKIANDSSKFKSLSGGMYIAGQLVTPITINKILYTQYSLDFTTTVDCNEAIFQLNRLDNLCLINFDDFVLTQLEGKPYLQFGKLIQDNEADITARYVAYSPLSSAPVTKTDLGILLAEAKNNVATASVGYGTGQYPQYAVDRISAVISTTDLALTNIPNYATVDSSYYYLDNTNTLFLQSKITDGNVKLASIHLSINNPVIKEQLTSQLTLTGLMSNNQPAGFTQDQIVYNILGSSIVSVDNTGLVTGQTPGTAQIEVVATVNEVTLKDTVDVQVVEYKFVTVNLQFYQAVVEVGEATGTRVSILMTDNTVPDEKYIQKQYLNLTPALAEINSFGTIIAKAEGEASIVIEATVLGITLRDTVKVNCIDLSDITLTIPITTMNRNESGTYTYTALMSDGNAIDLTRANALVVSDNRNIVQLDNKGNLKAMKVGTATIRFVANRNGKTLTETVIIEVKEVGSGFLNHRDDKKVFRLCPNPATTSVQVEIPSNKYVRLKLINLHGQEFYSQLIDNAPTVDVSLNVAPGCYFVQLISSENESATQKLIIR